MILLDTSALVDSFTGHQASGRLLREAIERGEKIGISSLVLYEWLRGPRLPHELAAQQVFLPNERVLLFGPAEAALSAVLYKSLPRARARQIDIAIAACAIHRQARLWTLNPRDFKDIPGLKLFAPV